MSLPDSRKEGTSNANLSSIKKKKNQTVVLNTPPHTHTQRWQFIEKAGPYLNGGVLAMALLQFQSLNCIGVFQNQQAS